MKPIAPFDKPVLLANEFLENNVGDCDCACSLATTDLSVRQDRSTRYGVSTQLYLEELQPDLWLSYSPRSPLGPCILNSAALTRLDRFVEVPRYLESDFDDILATHQLIETEEPSIPLQAVSPTELVVWIHISNACNLDCIYCYVSKSSEHMDRRVAVASIDAVFELAQSQNFDAVHIKYAGGEASLNAKILLAISERAMDLATSSKRELRETLLTNGVAIPDGLMAWLREPNRDTMISLDGLETTHDKLRPMKFGRGSYRRIIDNVEHKLLPAGIVPVISITITPMNLSEIRELMQWVLDKGLRFSLNLYRHNRYSTLDPDTVQRHEQQVINCLNAVYDDIETSLPERHFFNGLLDKVQLGVHYQTCGVGSNYLVVSNSGSVSQCQMQIDEVITDFVDAETIELIAAGPIQNLSVDDKVECQRCEFRYRCAGGCPLETFRETGNWLAKSPHCNIYKTLLPKALRLEGLRLLKVNGLL